MIADIVQTGLASWWAPLLAFAAGLVSLREPCVFPLVPGYVSFVSGEGALEADGEPGRPLVPILLFIAGFTIVFMLLGAFASTFVRGLQGGRGPADRRGDRDRVRRADDRLRARARLDRPVRGAPPFLQRVRPGTVGALPLGMAFAAGWTPCIGPVLGVDPGDRGLGQHRPRRGAAARPTPPASACRSCWWASGSPRFMGAFGWVKRHYAAIAAVSGALLVAVGVLLVTGQFTRLVAPLGAGLPTGAVAGASPRMRSAPMSTATDSPSGSRSPWCGEPCARCARR